MLRYRSNPENEPQVNFDDPNAVLTLRTYNYFSTAVQTGLLGDDWEAAYQEIFRYLESQPYFLAMDPANQHELINFLRVKVSSKTQDLLTVDTLHIVLSQIHQVLNKISISDPDFLRLLFPHAQLDLYLMKRFPEVKQQDLDELRTKLEDAAKTYNQLPEYLWLQITRDSGQDDVAAIRAFIKSFLPEVKDLSLIILSRFVHNYLGLLYQSRNSYFYQYIVEQDKGFKNIRSSHFFAPVMTALEEYQEYVKFIPLPDSILQSFLQDSYCANFFTRTLLREHREYGLSAFNAMGLHESVGHLMALKLQHQPEALWDPEYLEKWIGVAAETYHSNIKMGGIYSKNSELPIIFERTPILLELIDGMSNSQLDITPQTTNFKFAIQMLLDGYLPDDLKLFTPEQWQWIAVDGPSRIKDIGPDIFRPLIPLTLESVAGTPSSRDFLVYGQSTSAREHGNNLRAFSILVFLCLQNEISLDRLFHLDPRFWMSINVCHCSLLEEYFKKFIEDPQKANCHQSGHHVISSVLSRIRLLEVGANINIIQAWISEDVARRQKYHFVGFENYSFIDTDPEHPSTGNYLPATDSYYVTLAKLLNHLAVSQLSLLVGNSLEDIYALYWYLRTGNIDARQWDQLEFPALRFFFSLFHDYYESKEAVTRPLEVERIRKLLDLPAVWSILKTLSPIPRKTSDAFADEYGVSPDRFYAEAKKKKGEPEAQKPVPWHNLGLIPAGLNYLSPDIRSASLLASEIQPYKLLADILRLHAWSDRRYTPIDGPLTSSAVYAETFEYLLPVGGVRKDMLTALLVQQLFGEALFPQLDQYQANAVVKTLITIYRKTRRNVFDRSGGRMIEAELPKHLQSFSNFVRSLPNATFKKILDWIESLQLKKGFISEVCRLVIVFGNNYKPWLDAVIKSTLAQKMSNRLHTGLIVLPYRSIPGLADYLIKYKNSLLSTNGYAVLQALVGRWEDLNEQERQQPPALIYRLLLQKSYPNAKSPELAYEAAKAGISKRAYSALERRWITSLLTPSPIASEDRSNGVAIPPIEYRGYHGYFLDRSDPRGLFLGSYTNCCQHPNGAGSAAAWYGQESPLAGFFVVEDKNGRIVAQSLYWIQAYGDQSLHKKYSALVFDNVESKGLPPIRNRIVAEIYERVAKALLGKPLLQPGRYPSGLEIEKTLAIGVVNLGTSHGKLNYRKAKKAWSEKIFIGVPEDLDYTDAQHQVTIASDFKWVSDR